MKYSKLLLVGAIFAGCISTPVLTVASDHRDNQFVCDRESFTGCLNGVSSAVTTAPGLRVGTQNVAKVTRERGSKQIENAQVARQTTGTGLAAGDGMGSVLAMWGSYAYNDFESDFTSAGVPLGYDADSHNALGGVDRLFQGRYLLGLAFGYNTMESKTGFNGGEVDADTYTIAPYAAILLSDIFSLDFAGGYSWLDYDQTRLSRVDGTNIAASFDAERWFFATNLNAVMVVDKFVFGAKVGYLHTDEQQDAYTEAGSAASVVGGVVRTLGERDSDLSQVVVGAEIGYLAGAFEPFFNAEYRNDVSRDDGTAAGGLPVGFNLVQPRDDDEVRLGVGFRYYTTWGVTSTFEYQRVEGRSQFDSDLFMFTLRAAL
jgi:hypothetical protein